jgi:hypothetical protein
MFPGSRTQPPLIQHFVTLERIRQQYLLGMHYNCLSVSLHVSCTFLFAFIGLPVELLCNSPQPPSGREFSKLS